MNDLIVYRDAETRRKPSIAFECGLRLLLERQILGDLIDVGGRCSLANVLTKLEQNFANNSARAFHRLDFFRALQMDHQYTF